MSACTIFTNFAKPVEDKSLVIIANWIKSGKFRHEVEEIRSLIEDGETENASQKKKALLAFTPSATFAEKRLTSHVVNYTGFLHLDFDKLLPEQLQQAIQTVKDIPYTFLCFISPSGNGLKVFIEVDSAMGHHDIAYQQVQKYYEDATSLKADPSCKDITRLCFMSYDANLYSNIQSQKFKVVLPHPESMRESREPQVAIPHTPPPVPLDLNTAFIFNQQIHFTNQKSTYSYGNRNNYLHLLGSNCNRAGLSELDVIQYCIQSFDLPEKEVIETITGVYKRHAAEHAKFANLATSQTEDELVDFLKITPTIPDEIFEMLPDLLKHGTQAFSDKRKRDVFFTGAIAILSGCLPGVTGVYAQERIYPHLYTFIIAPAASGKGVLKNAKRLADKYHKMVVEQSREDQKKHEIEMLDYKSKQNQRKKDEPLPEKPEEKPFKVVFIPANCSQARIIEHLKANDGQGIICETEADTMSGTKKQDWGDYSAIMRAAFHHEKISVSRKTNNEFVEVDEPRIAIALTGTPAQAPRLIASAEDGLFSRFLFYAYKNEIEWQDPSPQNATIVYNDHFDKLADILLEGIHFLQVSPTEIELTNSQWQKLNETFRNILTEVTIFTSEDAASVVFRLGLVAYRLCMIFTALRKIENAEMTARMTCNEHDFTNAIEIIKTYLQHNILMFNNLPKQNDKMEFIAGDNKRKLFDALPAEFTRQQAVEIGKPFQLSPRTVDDILHNATGKALEKLKAGHYRKL